MSWSHRIMQNYIVILKGEILGTSDGIEIPQLSNAEQIFFLGNYDVIYMYMQEI